MNDITFSLHSSRATAPDGGIRSDSGSPTSAIWRAHSATAIQFARIALSGASESRHGTPPRTLGESGHGENGMHPEFKAILGYLRTKPVKLTITSNGHSVAVLEDDELRAFHDIEFSLDYVTQAEQDAQRGHGNGNSSPAGKPMCEAGQSCNHYRRDDEVEPSRLADVAR